MEKRNVRIIFVLPTNCTTEVEASEEMQQAYEACRQNGIKVDWYQEQNCLELEFNKTDFLIFQTFEGEIFEKIKKTKSVRIVGPWCLLTCLTEGKQIPNFPWPIYSVAMSGCTVTCSSLQKPQRKDLQDKIECMSGYFSTNLTGNCTHLITDSVKSEKYIKAAEAGVKIMLSSWVDDVWETSTKGNVHCNNKQFEKHRCPTFHKLVVCCTGFNNAQRSVLRQATEENGGTYREQLHISSTDLLVCDRSSLTSAKYRAAKKHNIKCVAFEWVTESIKNGYAMPDNLYPVKVGTSTPTKEGEDVCPNFSMISNIENSALMANRSPFLDTIDMTNMSKLAVATPKLKRKSLSNEHNDLVDEINLKQVKMAGPFLDGCGIYLVGFGAEQREKLCKVLNFSGATRYDDITERVSHVIVGDTLCHELKLLSARGLLKNSPLVKIHWLIDSIAKQFPVDEASYVVSAVSSSADEPSSPLSKKGLHLLRTNSGNHITEKLVEVPISIAQPEPDIDLVQQYLCPNASSQEDTLAKLLQDAGQFDSKQDTVQPDVGNGTSQIDSLQDVASSSKQKENKNLSTSQKMENTKNKDNSYDKPQNESTTNRDASLSSAIDDSSQPTEPIYEGLKFIIVGFTEEQQNQVRLAVETMAGKVVSRFYKGVPDYAVVPVFSSELKQAATEVVTDLWITECWQENEIRPVEYFHRPISVNEDTNPLNGCVVTISSYANYERIFLRNLIIQMGGVCQEQFSRINSEKNGIVTSTHLISPEPTGRKYAAALKWSLPVINKDWLLECARTSQLVSENLFLVGEAQCKPRTATSKSIENTSSKSVTTSKSNVYSTTKLSSPQPSTSYVNDAVSELSKSPLQTSTSNQEPTTTKSALYRNSSGTPVQEKFATSSSEHTPVNRIFNNVQNTSGICSQVTPVQKIIAEARKRNLLGTPQESLPFPKAWDHVDTPETPLGAFIRPNPSPNLRKEMVRFLNTLPDYKPRRESTPLSELKRRLWDKICPPKDSQNAGIAPEQLDFDVENEGMPVDVQENLEKAATPLKINSKIPDNIVNSHLQQLQDMLSSSGGNRTNSKNRRQSIIPVAATEVKDSQPNTIGWDDCMDCDNIQNPQKALPVFMFSGLEVDKRELLIAKLESLGAVVSNLSNFDPLCTHLICPKPMRNEKILACIASGKWILHLSYVDKCAEEGKLVNEEPFEYGNPKSKENSLMQVSRESEARVGAMHYWRKEITTRGYGPFHDMRAIIVAQKRDPILRVLQAGGGMIVEASPPFTKAIHATHCLLEPKFVKISDYIPLAKQGIYCINVLYVSELLQRTASDVTDYIIPNLMEYY